MICKTDNCCGCTACVSICPKTCISMKENKEGFLYPQMDKALCISCGLCKKVCPILQKKEQIDLKEAYAAITNDRDTLMRSSSGGLFTEIAKAVLSEGGVVFGAAFRDDYYSVHHVIIENEEELVRLRGSKYLQSEMGNCYNQAKEQLIAGRTVLFSGTTCQIAGLKSFLGKEYNRLLCIDVICHGTPSPRLWRSYLTDVERKMGGKAISVCFRHKQNGWRLFGVDMQTLGGKHYYNTVIDDPYMQIFLKNYCLRESCYQCVIKENGAVSDITIGDYWSVGRVEPDIDSSMGVSLAFIHTEKGKHLFEKVKPFMLTRKTDYDQAVIGNSAYNHSVARPTKRDRFFVDLEIMGWRNVEKKYAEQKIFIKIKRILSKSFIGKIRRLI